MVMLAKYLPYPNQQVVGVSEQPCFRTPYTKHLGRTGPSEGAGVSEKYGNNDDDNGDHWSSDAVWHRDGQ